MMTIEELLAPVTGDEVLEKFLTMLETAGVPARSWREGGVYRTILRVVADVYAGFTNSALGFARAAFLETSTGGWLTLLAYYVYGVTRIPATFATGNVSVTNGGGGVYTVTAGELRVLNAVTGKAFTNTAGATFNPATTTTVPMRAVEAGSASTSAVATLTQFETPLLGLTVTNAAALVGADEEKDPELRQRCKDKLGIIGGKGPRGAYSYAVRSATRGDGSAVNVNRVRISPSSSTGTVQVIVASPTGAPDPGDLPYIEANIEALARPDTVTVSVLGATPAAFSRTLTVWARAQDGLTASDLSNTVGTALATWLASYPIGGIPKPPSTQGYLYADGIAGTVKAAHPAIFDVDGTGADIALAIDEVATLTATITVRLVEVST
jgi:hypothetical protein